MDVMVMLGSCARRWYVAAPVLLLSGGLAAQAHAQVEPLFTASSSIVILPSQTQSDGATPEEPTADNPYAGSGGAKLAAAVLSKNINSTSFRSGLDPAVAGSVTIASAVADQQPIITVEATAGTAHDVRRVLVSVTSSARTVLDEFQAAAQAPVGKRYLVAATVPAGETTDLTPSRWRTAGAILTLGAGSAGLLAVSIDSALRPRRSRQRRLPATTAPRGRRTRTGPSSSSRSPDRSDIDTTVRHSRR